MAGCMQFYSDWSEEFELFLLTRNTSQFPEAVTQFCGNGKKQGSITRACYGVDLVKYGAPADFNFVHAGQNPYFMDLKEERAEEELEKKKKEYEENLAQRKQEKVE